jgi:biopolymer transport protein TolR
MATGVTPRSPGGRFERRRSSRPICEINVTPMVDVMLVMLVIFMITAPLMTTGVEVDLPKTKAAVLQEQDQPIAVTVDRQGRIFVRDREVALTDLASQVMVVARNNPDTRVFVRGDQAIRYGNVMTVIGTLHSAGLRKVALLTDLAEDDAAVQRRNPPAARIKPQG